MPSRETGHILVATGSMLFVLGIAWEIQTYVSQGWPTGLTWIMMVAGLVMVAMGLRAFSRKAAGVTGALLLVIVVVLAVLWAMS